MIPKRSEIVVLLNIIAPYKTLLFNTLTRISGNFFRVVYLAETAYNRDWQVGRDTIRFPYRVLSRGKGEDADSVVQAFRTWRVLSEYDPLGVVVNGYDHPAYFSALAWAKVRGRKAAVLIESHRLDRTRTFVREGAKKILVSGFDAALVDGSRHREYAASLGIPTDRIFIKNGTGPVDIDFFGTGSDRARKGKGEACRSLGIPQRNFLFVGRFSAEKNLPVLLEAYHIARGKGMNGWGLILLGDGPQRREIERRVAELKVPDVLMPGFFQQEELPSWYALADLLVLPSLSEPWGLVVNEAMACGLPVIVSDRCGCYPDLVRPGINGEVFDPRSPEDLASYMAGMAGNEDRLVSMGRAGKAAVREFAPDPVAERYLEAFRAIWPEAMEGIPGKGARCGSD